MLNNIDSGLLPHKLRFNIGATVMLIRNISIEHGLCNGTRLKIVNLWDSNIETKIISGDLFGSIIFIRQITLNTTEYSKLPFVLIRKQFPIILAFATTINKSQG